MPAVAKYTGPCLCGHTEGQHFKTDLRKCRFCACFKFRYNPLIEMELELERFDRECANIMALYYLEPITKTVKNSGLTGMNGEGWELWKELKKQ